MYINIKFSHKISHHDHDYYSRECNIRIKVNARGCDDECGNNAKQTDTKVEEEAKCRRAGTKICK